MKDESIYRLLKGKVLPAPFDSFPCLPPDMGSVTILQIYIPKVLSDLIMGGTYSSFRSHMDLSQEMRQ